MLEKQPKAPKFLDRTQTAFRELHGTCDSVYRGLHQEGAGSGQRFVILPHLQQQKNRRFGRKVCSAALIQRICSVPFSFILVSDSVLEGVRNSGDWGLLSLCILLTQIVSHIEGFHDVTTFR